MAPIFKRLPVDTPCGKTLDVVYTNRCEILHHGLNILSNLYEEADEEHKFFGLDLEYMANQKDVAVIQIAHEETVLVFQWAGYAHDLSL